MNITESTRSPMASLEARVLDELRRQNVQNCRILVAVSGGLDSVSLLACLIRIKKILKLELSVLHVHHGGSGKQRQWRDNSANFVKQLAEKVGLPFFTNSKPPHEDLRTEEELRKFRYEYIRNLVRLEHFQFVALAHHADDLLETRLIRLIRGTGEKGLLGMEPVRGDRLRPLLHTSRSDVLNYATKRKLDWLEDPSNQSQEPLRNWIRLVWLPELEKKRPGASRALARSLDILAQDAQLVFSHVEGLMTDSGVRRMELMQLPQASQRRVLVRYLENVGIYRFTTSQIDEVLRRLQSSVREFSFRVMSCNWIVNAEFISASPDPSRIESGTPR